MSCAMGSHSPFINASRAPGFMLHGTVTEPADTVFDARSIVTSVSGAVSTTRDSASRSSCETATHGIPRVVELPKKISAKLSATTARMPYFESAWGACSREEPQPKLAFERRMLALAKRGSLSG